MKQNKMYILFFHPLVNGSVVHYQDECKGLLGKEQLREVDQQKHAEEQ